MTEEAERPSPPEELAAACVRYVKDAVGFELDFTSDTLPVLDHYVRSGIEAAAQNAQAREELVALLAPVAGAYFGEVVRRAMAGTRWHSQSEDYRGYRVEFEPFFLCFNPIGIAMEVATQEDAAGWNAHFQLLEDTRAQVERSLAESSEVGLDDYYTFSVRFETLQHIADVLGSLESKHKQRRSFGPDVYGAAHGERGKGGEA